jgi:hypothetical protein
MNELSTFMSREQRATLSQMLHGAERNGYADTLLALAERIKIMPVSNEANGLEDAVVHLRYFAANCEWWITEKHAQGVPQAQGWVTLNGAGIARADRGYVRIAEIVANGAALCGELDLHWVPKKVSEITRGKP